MYFTEYEDCTFKKNASAFLPLVNAVGSHGLVKFGGIARNKNFPTPFLLSITLKFGCAENRYTGEQMS